MLFNSLVFLLLFLPGSLLLLALAEQVAPRSRLPILVLLSFVFYGWWDLRFVPLLAASIVLNWAAGGIYARTRQGWVIPLAIVADLALLGLFKYLGFFADLLNALPGASLPHVDLAFPIGISFFTFQHVMYLADLRAGRTEPVGLMRYALYVAFFPRVLAGPLVRPNEFMAQLGEPAWSRPDAAARFARGLMLLIAGLAKKVFLSDPLGAFVNPVFANAAKGVGPSVIEGWQAILGYTFQLYLDFSGYTDMALGLALMLGIVLPQNFDAPYRASSIQDFWRRWHITLSLFLRDYLYIPMGGSRHGLTRQLLALIATMALGGLWHGAGLTFVAWGAVHGLALAAHVLWRKEGLAMPAALGVLCTFVFVALAWVLFRAPSFAAAVAIYKGAFGAGGLGKVDTGFWPLLAVCGVFAVVGPTVWRAVHRVPPGRWIAVAATVLLVLVLLKVGDDANFEFIYAQF
jgi:D-alanyl-lipoteichoic acid acyltransferase DltB (MBOAT superfamily)